MTAKQRKEKYEDETASDREGIGDKIGQNVLRELGQPDRLLQVQVRCLWVGRYRVNVLVGANAASATVAHSYFLEADDDGYILTSAPTITRQY